MPKEHNPGKRPHEKHECQYCGTMWDCEAGKPKMPKKCVRPRLWPCRPCWNKGRPDKDINFATDYAQRFGE